MKVGKPKSKRQSVRLRHKIEKASSAKQRKDRKTAKKDPTWRSRLKKDPGIPNLFPYKAKLIAELEESKRRKAEEQLRKRELAKARRQGVAVSTPSAPAAHDVEASEDEDEGGMLVDESASQDMEVDDQNPMAALLASAEARANTYNGAEDGEEEDENDEDDGWNGLDEGKTSQEQRRNKLPKQALEDPVKAVSLLLSHAQKNSLDGVQTITDYYQLPFLSTTASDFSTRLLVEVARKKGRLGRGGIPNLHSAALLVLNDINEERLQLPAAPAVKAGTGNSTIVKQMAAPFRLEGLWGDKKGDVMAVDG